MNGPTRSEIAEHATSDACPEPETEKCDGCECEFDPDDLTRHEDGNRYCEGCNYITEQDRTDDEGDRLYHEMREN